MDFSTQYNEVSNSVVKVLSFQNHYYQKIILGNGSGILIGDGSMAITCSHCILPNTLTNCVTQKNASYGGQIIYNNPMIDIAIIRFTQSIGKGIKLGDPTNIKIGQEAFVVGYPFHTKSISTMGANISGIETNSILIDASVNHGNSGGPLFNTDAELIGIVNSKLGSVSKFLNQIESLKSNVAIQIGGLDPIHIIQQLIGDIKKNLNLGMGAAVPLKLISESNDIIKNLLENTNS